MLNNSCIPSLCVSPVGHTERVVIAFGVGVAIVDALGMALLATSSAFSWDTTSRGDTVYTVVMLLQLTVFWGKPWGEIHYVAFGNEDGSVYIRSVCAEAVEMSCTC